MCIRDRYQDNYSKIREVLPKVGAVTMVQCNFSQYSSRYHDFCAGKVWPSFDPVSYTHLVPLFIMPSIIR